MKGSNNSLDPYKRISTALLCDVQRQHDGSYNKSALRTDIRILCSRLAEEGMGFLTKTLPQLGKRLDQALASHVPFRAEDLRFQCRPDSKLPKFLGELFAMVFDDVGLILPSPSVKSVRSLRQICYSFYKLELPYAPELEQSVIQEFERTDESLSEWNAIFQRWNRCIDERNHVGSAQRVLQNSLSIATIQLRVEETRLEELNRSIHNNSVIDPCINPIKDEDMDAVKECVDRIGTFSRKVSELRGQIRWLRVLMDARRRLHDLFRCFDPMDIVPNHGPGAVSTREQYQGKWRWTHIHDRLAAQYPIDEYFFVSLSHVADRLQTLMRLGDSESPARVCLVPKDSRGPRLISCEPLEHQWIQQGLSRAIVTLVERHPKTRGDVRFTDQAPNRYAALLGSATGRYATLDLKEASDRVCLELVRVLFPAHLVRAMEACRSQETQLPDGRRVKLQKWAPMGSALCFPVLALTIWSLLRAGFTDATGSRSRKRFADKSTQVDETADVCYVYGDDVIVPTAKAADAIAILDSFGLKTNVDKSCTGGGPSFRESCGMDAFRGEPVTPVRFRTAWTSSQHPGPYQSYIEYANALWARGYYHTHEVIVKLLFHMYGPLADDVWDLPVPSVVGLPECYRSNKRRVNKDLQKMEYRVLTVVPRTIKRPVDGWMMLLRYLTSKEVREFDENSRRSELVQFVERLMGCSNDKPRRCGVGESSSSDGTPFSASSYTKRSGDRLAWSWC